MTRAPRQRWWLRLAVTAAVAVGLMLLSAPIASAHAVLESTDPADGAVLPESPAQVTMTFNETITLAAHGTSLLDGQGKQVPADIVAVDNTVRITPTAAVADGSYIVTWRVISADTHPVSGGITFAVGAPSATSVEAPDQATDRPVTVVRLIIETLRYIGILGFAGLLYFAVFIAGSALGASEGLTARIRRITRSLAATAIAAAVLMVPMERLWQDGDGLPSLLSPSLWRQAILDPAAVAALLITTGIIAAWIGSRRQLATVTAAGLAVTLGALIVEGHTRSYGPAYLTVPADLLHVTTAALWFGGLIGLTIVLVTGTDARPTATAAAVDRFSTIAAWLVTALTVAAIVLWWRIAGSITGLWTTDYGRLVLIKIILAAIVSAVAAWNRYRLVPSVTGRGRRRSSPPNDEAPVTASRDRALTRLRRAVTAEVVILVAVIGVTAVLTSETPTPPAGAVADQPASTTVTAGEEDLIATFVITPAAVGINSVHLSLADDAGRPVTTYNGLPPDLTVTLKGTTIGPFRHELVPIGRDSFEATVDLPLPGTWMFSLVVRTGEFDSPTVSTEVTVS